MSRTVVATVLVLLGCLLAGPAVAAYALTREISYQDRYLAAVTPLADDPVVRDAVAARITDAISKKLGPGDRELPASVRRVVDTGVRKFVDSNAFRPAWITVNRQAHPQVIAMLRDEPDALRIEDDEVLLDLGVVVEDIKSRLAAEGVPLAEQLPKVEASIHLFSRPAVRRAIPAFGTLEKLSIALPVAVIALLAIGIASSARRGRTLFIAGTGLATAMLLLLLYREIGHGQLVARSRSPELAGAFYDALTSHVTILLWLVFGIAAVAALAVAGRTIHTRIAQRP